MEASSAIRHSASLRQLVASASLLGSKSQRDQLSVRSPCYISRRVFQIPLSVDKTKQQGIRYNGGLLPLRATARPLDNSHESVIEPVQGLVNGSSANNFGWIDVFYRFTRPHTVIGTAIGIISISLLAVQTLEDFSMRFAIGLAQALVPALFMNVYIVGLNQISDIDIDKVNKPYLPLASGEYTLKTGIAIVTAFAIASLAMGAYIGSQPLLWALLISFALGTAYSIKLPFLRWKRSAFAAATCILAVRAIIVQLCFYMHMQSFVFGRALIMTRPLIFATGFMCFFSVVIALFKDIPDLEGDRFFGIQSYTVRLGQERVSTSFYSIESLSFRFNGIGFLSRFFGCAYNCF
ncbi:hypothetical protein KP509_13G056000 [Ceratopteris richardii]|uniref:Homogentisate phytyltransferase n=1 Tax=Ceratopteris richardii TaxID=49495 RepID=A0A8T2TJ67_CERRI|nr:hypothetical protein KP509_13G056000 [Ceratopteris richardii]